MANTSSGAHGIWQINSDSQRDGLWVVIRDDQDPRRRFVAAYVMERGKVKWCAPILRRRLAYWQTQARFIGP